MAFRRLAVVLASLLAACATTADEPVQSDEADLSLWEPISAALGNPPNFAQLGNGSTMSVVSRAWGRGAKTGALVELYYPHYDSDNLWDSYVGVRTRGQPMRWAHDLTLVRQSIVPDTGRVVTELSAPGLSVVLEDVVRPEHDAHLRHVVVKNTGSRTLEDVDVAFYAYFAIGNFPAGDRLRAQGNALVQTDDGAGISVAATADRPASQVHCGSVLWPFGGNKDARMAAEGNDLSRCDGVEAGLGGVNGVLQHRLPNIAPGQTQEVTYAIGLGRSEREALAEATAAASQPFGASAREDEARWTADLARAPLPKSLPADARDVYRRAIVTVLQHRVDNGAFIAAPTLTSPVYKLVWPRDGSKTAVDMLEAGFAPEAKAFFERLETMLLPNGSFAVNYRSDTSGPFFDFGASGNENDQPGMLPWGVARVLAVTGDEAWATARWPAVRRTAEHMLSITPDGLVLPSRDLWELETDKSWTYAQGSAIAGLESAATIARTANAPADADRYLARARQMRDVLGERMVTDEGFFARGTKKGRIDDRLEIANLALGRGGFGLLPDTDPRLAKIGDLVEERLGTPGGSVRRYEGDRYYGGQPWPVASVWLAIHKLERGDRAGAEALFRVITEQAHATETSMLGEQFDEKKRVWQSAMPLVWSEAAYVRLAKALYD